MSKTTHTLAAGQHFSFYSSNHLWQPIYALGALSVNPATSADDMCRLLRLLPPVCATQALFWQYEQLIWHC